ncbi:MAG: glutathione S-transferase family protein [Alphaproteobacteria bacterium]
MKLFIANKNYSSWSFRPWLALKVKQVEFEEDFQRFDDENQNPHFKEFSPAGKVPTLKDEDLYVWDSLAILEYLADLHPDKGFWPTDVKQRAHARAISNEMHSGFSGLRSECPMNMRRPVETLSKSDAVVKDVERIEAIWSSCLAESGGPFLFGEFSNADAMFAPVVSRIKTYTLSTSAVVQAYTAAMTSLPAWQEWEAAALEEPWIVENDEI